MNFRAATRAITLCVAGSLASLATAAAAPPAAEADEPRDLIVSSRVIDAVALHFNDPAKAFLQSGRQLFEVRSGRHEDTARTRTSEWPGAQATTAYRLLRGANSHLMTVITQTESGDFLGGALGGGLYLRSQDQDWQQVLPGVEIGAIAKASTTTSEDDGALYIGTTQNGVWTSEDSGRTWSSTGQWPEHADVTALARGTDSSLYATTGTSRTQLLRSHDGGKTWNAQPIPFSAQGLRYVTAARDWLLAWTADGSTFRSFNEGATFEQVRWLPRGARILDAAQHAATPSLLHFAIDLDGELSLRTVAATTKIEFQSGRFEVDVEWSDGRGNSGMGTAVTVANGTDVALRSSDSAIIQFFGNDNWELLLKVLDAQFINNKTWVFLAAASDVGYQVKVTDTVCGSEKVYSGSLGAFQPATTDTDAFGSTCSAPAPPSCQTDDGVICLGADRFQVEVEWQDFSGGQGIGRQVTVPTGGQASSNDSGLFTFFDAANWEMLVKVLDGCALNNRFWVFNAATTDVAFTLTVRDVETGAVRRWSNPLGTAAVPFGRTSAFPCEDDPPEPEPEDSATFRLNRSGYNNKKFTFSESGGNHIFCRPQGQKQIWIRLARDPQNDGENSPHLDLDVCNYSGGGVFEPGAAPLAPSCNSGKQWDVFWHEGSATFVNEATSSPCQLDIKQKGDVLTGTFECSGMKLSQGQTLDVSRGSFRCTMDP